MGHRMAMTLPSNVFGRLFGSARRQQAVEEELRRTRDEAIEATRAKSAFLAEMSHEIRTPMNGIVGMVELLKGSGLDHRQRAYVATIEGSVDALLTITNDILDLSKIEAGKMSLDARPFDLRGLIEEVARLLAPRARQKGLSISYQVAPEVPARLIGDPVRIRQILTNFAANAVKFTDAGEVTLQARVLKATEDGPTIHLAVRDTGIGISLEHQAVVFESYTQLEDDPERLHGGTGLGLTICRSLVALMHGRIGVESLPGVGSTFWVELRLASALEAAPGATGPTGDETEAPLDVPLHVLVVEDHDINRHVAAEMIRLLGCHVDAVGDGREALAVLEGRAYDIVLMDIQLPGLDGLATTAELRRREASTGRHVPIIALTANAMAGDRQRCLRAGMDDYLAKPLRTRTLRQAHVRWGRESTDQALENPRAPAPAPVHDGWSFDRNVLAECCGEQPRPDRRCARDLPPLRPGESHRRRGRGRRGRCLRARTRDALPEGCLPDRRRRGAGGRLLDTAGPRPAG